MTAIAIRTTTQSNSSFRILLFLIALVLAFASVSYGYHAIERHGEAAIIVRECLNRQEPILKMRNPETGRLALVCKISESKFGIQIVKGEHEITAFIKEKMKCLDQVKQYLLNRGYQ